MPRLTSLLEQNYPHYEILMLDVNSEDATRRCAEAIASRSSGHLRIISGTTLPEGWTGESWACHQRAASSFLPTPIPLKTALALECETNSGANHAEIVVRAIDHVPTEVVHDADMRSNPNFDAPAKLADAFGV